MGINAIMIRGKYYSLPLYITKPCDETTNDEHKFSYGMRNQTDKETAALLGFKPLDLSLLVDNGQTNSNHGSSLQLVDSSSPSAQKEVNKIR